MERFWGTLEANGFLVTAVGDEVTKSRLINVRRRVPKKFGLPAVSSSKCLVCRSMFRISALWPAVRRERQFLIVEVDTHPQLIELADASSIGRVLCT
jgi:hypothetical protein